MDRIQTLRTFARVAELKNFTLAADQLGLPKASVSTQIQQLENELGTQLLQRTTRRVHLTHDGIAFYERTQDILSDLDELKSMFQSGSEKITGRIRVDMPSRMARFRIVPRLPEFYEAYPGIQIEIGSTDRNVDLIQEGYDCVIRGGTLDDSSLIAKKIGEMKNINVASPSYLKKNGTPRSIKDLSHHILIHYVSAFGEKPTGFEYQEGGRSRSREMRGFLTVNNAETYVSACEAGLGIIQTPAGTLEALLRKGKLVEILPKLTEEPMPVYLIYPHRRNLPKRLKVFMDWIEQVLR